MMTMTQEVDATTQARPALQRVSAIDWERVRVDLDSAGFALLPGLLADAECDALAGDYGPGPQFRSHVMMARHGFGRGEYRYYSYPLPPLVQDLRTALYPQLAPIANRWNMRMGLAGRYPDEHADYLHACHAAGQARPTPLLLGYGEGDYNCLHQDLYGDLAFPLQVAVLLSVPGEDSRGGDFTGGEFVLTEQRPRMQTRVEVVPLAMGDAVVFAVNERPSKGVRGDYRVKMRHGVSRLRSGHRHTLGIIFHDAR